MHCLKVASRWLMLLAVCIPLPSYAIDVVHINKGQSDQDIRTIYTYTILERVLAITAPEFGQYKIDVVGQAIPNIRTMQALIEGKILNVAMAVTSNEWEEKTIPIRIPLRRGVLNYRLLAINKSKLALFEDIKTLTQLKELTVGLRRNWTTWAIMRELGFTITNAYSYDAIFGMLDKNRFDYIPRGMHEIYDEIAIRQDQLTNIMVEPNLALYIPAPFYMFVSPTAPRLAQRLELGLERMVANGEIKAIFEDFYAEHIQRANLSKRTIIYVGNPLLPPKTPLHRKELWMGFDLLDQPADTSSNQ